MPDQIVRVRVLPGFAGNHEGLDTKMNNQNNDGHDGDTGAGVSYLDGQFGQLSLQYGLLFLRTVAAAARRLHVVLLAVLCLVVFVDDRRR